MASIGNDKNGRKRFLFVAGDGKRKTIRLGELSRKQAEAFKVKLQALIGGRICGVVDDEVSRWLRDMDDATYSKLVAVGLAPSREPTTPVDMPTLGAFIDTYLAGRTDLKPSTLVCLGQARRNLVAYFGETKALQEITEGDADEFWRYLIGKLSVNTARRISGRAKQFFRFAMRKKYVTSNPFADLKTNVKANADRRFFVTEEMAVKVLEACPDAEWRLIFSLSRYGGLRCPSEHLSLKWTDVDFDAGRIRVPSPKTEHIEGMASRVIPMFPELRKALMEAFEQAPEGAVFAVNHYRDKTMNLRTQFQRILKRAGLEPWPKLFHNLRSTRQTELAKAYPIHIVCKWIGNTEKVAKDHYLQITDADFAKAIAEPATALGTPANSAAQNPAQQPSETTGSDKKSVPLVCRSGEENPVFAGNKGDFMASIGLEPILLLGNGF